MRAHFRHLRFNSFPILQITPQCKVFWPLQWNSEVLGVPAGSQVLIPGVWVSSSHSPQSRVVTKMVVFESKKLSETKWRWPTHEKKMWAVIHCLKTWGQYIGSKDVAVWTDNVTLKYFTTKLKLSSKQVRWQNTLALFNVNIRHKPGKDNVVFDVLSRNSNIRWCTWGKQKFKRKFVVNCRDKFAKERKQNIWKGIKSHFHLQDELLWYKQNWFYVFERRLQDVLLKEHVHDGPLMGHGGVKCTILILKKT
jgi:hypothetical protein